MKRLKPLIEITTIILLFIIVSIIAQKYIFIIQSTIGDGIPSMLLYLLITITAIVIAPITTLPLIPIASNLFGPFLAAILSIIGWTIGAFIAFIIARKYGVPIVKKLINLKKLEHIEKLIPEQNLFITIIFLRMIIPADILSYALGLFSNISKRNYTLATLIGVTPFGFIFAYLGTIPNFLTISILIITSILILTTIYIIFKKN